MATRRRKPLPMVFRAEFEDEDSSGSSASDSEEEFSSYEEEEEEASTPLTPTATTPLRQHGGFDVTVATPSTPAAPGTPLRQRVQEGLEFFKSPSSWSSPHRERAANRRRAQMVSEAEEQLTKDRASLGLFSSPFRTLGIFLSIASALLKSALTFIAMNNITAIIVLSSIVVSLTTTFIPGPHQAYAQEARTWAGFVLYWVLLGIASSVGLGFGLHTFVLFLGPYIAKTTLVAYECGTLAFTNAGENEFLCTAGVNAQVPVTFFGIVAKVQLAAFLWGLGTAIGELPPYFVARAARNAGQHLEDLEEMEGLDRKQPNIFTHAKIAILEMLQRYGFIGIALFASIPNPLFDLAGLTCGYLRVPFWTFFGATVIGKAINKASIQSVFVIWLFSEHHVEHAIEVLEAWVPALQGKILSFVATQKAKLSGGAAASAQGGSLFGLIWNLFLGGMIFWFIKAIIEHTVDERVESVGRIHIEDIKRQPLPPAQLYRYPLLAGMGTPKKEEGE